MDINSNPKRTCRISKLGGGAQNEKIRICIVCFASEKLRAAETESVHIHQRRLFYYTFDEYIANLQYCKFEYTSSKEHPTVVPSLTVPKYEFATSRRIYKCEIIKAFLSKDLSRVRQVSANTLQARRLPFDFARIPLCT